MLQLGFAASTTIKGPQLHTLSTQSLPAVFVQSHSCKRTLSPRKINNAKHLAMTAKAAQGMATKVDIKDGSPKSAPFAKMFTSTKEQLKPIDLVVDGKIPSYVQGSLYRNGPGIFEVTHSDGQTTPISHWFDGVSMIHRFFVDGQSGSITYNSRVTAPGFLNAAASVPKDKWFPGILFGVQDPCKSIFGKMMSMFRSETPDPSGAPSANIGVTVETVPGFGLLSRTDYNSMFEFDSESLEMHELQTWASAAVSLGASPKDVKGLKGEMSAAHGEYDEQTKEYYNFACKLGPNPVTYNIVRARPNTPPEVIASIKDDASYVHSMALTENYLVFIVYPLKLDSLGILFNKSFSGAMSWDKDAKTNFYVISRKEQRVVAKYSSEAFWCFHTVNAFEDKVSGDVHIDLCHYKSAAIVHDLTIEKIRSGAAQSDSENSPSVHRYTLPAVASHMDKKESGGSPPGPFPVKSRQICSAFVELPRINPLYNMKEQQYIYGPAFSDGGHPGDGQTAFKQIAKIDCRTGNFTTFDKPNTYVTEAIFVPNPSGVAEDDGSLLCVGFDATTQASRVFVVDARTMTETASAACPLVPAGFHGAFKP